MKKMFIINETREDRNGCETFPVRVVKKEKVIQCVDKLIEDTITMLNNRGFTCVQNHAWYNLENATTAPHLGTNYRLMVGLLFTDYSFDPIDDVAIFIRFDGEEVDVFEQ